MSETPSHRTSVSTYQLLNTGLYQVHGQYVEGWNQRAESDPPLGMRDLVQVQGSFFLEVEGRTPLEAPWAFNYQMEKGQALQAFRCQRNISLRVDKENSPVILEARV